MKNHPKLAFSCAIAIVPAVLMAGFLPCLSYANPQNGQVTAGQAIISESGTKLDVHQSTDQAVINWSNFEIKAGEHTQFHQPSVTSMTLNRVRHTNPIKIIGQMTANGKVVLVNSNGVFFDRGANIDVHGIVASTSHQPEMVKGDIINSNQTTTGLVALLAPAGEQNKTIKTTFGKVTMASGDSFTLDMVGDQLIEVAVKEELRKEMVKNQGEMDAESGVITLTASAARDVMDGLVSHGSTVNATGFTQKDGKIILFAESSSTE